MAYKLMWNKYIYEFSESLTKCLFTDFYRQYNSTLYHTCNTYENSASHSRFLIQIYYILISSSPNWSTFSVQKMRMTTGK